MGHQAVNWRSSFKGSWCLKSSQVPRGLRFAGRRSALGPLAVGQVVTLAEPFLGSLTNATRA